MINDVKYKIDGYCGFDDKTPTITYWVVEADVESTLRFIRCARSMSGGAEYEKVSLSDYVNDILSTVQEFDNRTDFRF